MTDSEFQQIDVLGQVLRASTRGFVYSPRNNKVDDRHQFGAFVRSPVAETPNTQAIGLIYAIHIKDDPLARELAIADVEDYNVLLDHRDNRMIPMEINVLNVGYSYNNFFQHSLPPRPPLSLSDVELCTVEEIYYFTRSQDYFRLLLDASEVPADDLLAAAILYAAYSAYDEATRYDFLVACGRKLAGLLTQDLKRLSHLLTLIRP